MLAAQRMAFSLRERFPEIGVVRRLLIGKSRERWCSMRRLADQRSGRAGMPVMWCRWCVTVSDIGDQGPIGQPFTLMRSFEKGSLQNSQISPQEFPANFPQKRRFCFSVRFAPPFSSTQLLSNYCQKISRLFRHCVSIEVQKVQAFLRQFIGLLMGLFRGAVCHHGGEPENCPLPLDR